MGQLAIRAQVPRFGHDNSFDVVAIHGVGGVVGMLMIGLVGTTAVNPSGVDGLFHGGDPQLLGVRQWRWAPPSGTPSSSPRCWPGW